MGHFRALLVLLVLVLIPLAAASAQAQRGRNHIDSVRFDVHMDFGWHQSFGVGFRADIPIVPRGLIDGADDELAISPGLEMFFYTWHKRDRNHWAYYGDGVSLWPLVALQWNFYLNRHWSIFPELGVAFYWYTYDDDRDDRRSRVGVHPFLGFGARYHFSARNALLMRINWPAGLQIGITF